MLDLSDRSANHAAERVRFQARFGFVAPWRHGCRVRRAVSGLDRLRPSFPFRNRRNTEAFDLWKVELKILGEQLPQVHAVSELRGAEILCASGPSRISQWFSCSACTDVLSFDQFRALAYMQSVASASQNRGGARMALRDSGSMEEQSSALNRTRSKQHQGVNPVKLLKTLTAGIAFALVLPLVVRAAAADDPVMGTWKLDVAKSTYSPGPAPKSEERTYAETPDGIKMTQKGESAAGEPLLSEATFKYDGKDYPVTGNPFFDTVLVKKTGKNTAKADLKRGGKVVGHLTRVVSADGRTLTVKTNVTGPKGEVMKQVLVYDRE